MRAVVHGAYGLYSYLIFITIGLAALAAIVVVPGIARRRVIARVAARLVLRLVGMRLEVTGLERLPAGACVVVANHASYLDGLVLAAALPPRFGFVIKREMAGVPLAASLLHRVGAEFLERFDRIKAATDTRRVLRKAAAGQSLVFFPEGTFSEEPGLLKFHAGAFHIAARAGCPVVPAAVWGTRQALAPGRLLPQAVPIAVELLPVVRASAAESTAGSGMVARELCERARQAILHHLSERDLAAA